MSVGLIVEDAADCQDGAPQVGQEDNSVALLGFGDRVFDHLPAGAQSAINAARGDDAGFATGDLADKVGKTSSELSAVRNKYDTDHF
jgi:hypothetical protein